MKISIEAITAHEVERFALDAEKNRAADGSLVLYPKRARALANNPDGGPDAPVLLLADHEGQCVGYAGILWDRLRFRSRTYRWAWGSQFYVVPDYRRHPVAFLLLKAALRLAEGFGVCGITPDAAKVFKAFGAWEPCSMTQFDVSRTQSAIDPIGRRLPATRRLLAPVTWVEEYPLRVWARRLLDALEVTAEPASHAGPIEDQLIDEPHDGAQFLRSRARLDWYLQFPWVSCQEGEFGEPWTSRPHRWTRFRPRHTFRLYTLASPQVATRGYTLVCHTQRDHGEASRTCLLDWDWSRADNRAFEVAVAVAAQSHLTEETHKLEISAAERHRRQAESIPGLRASTATPQVFLACCRRGSTLLSEGLKELAAEEWRLGGAEGDQLPIFF
jgi:GNAT superfamily N-acetyltransferase